MRHKTRPAPKIMTALHVGVTARKGHIAHAVWKGKKFSQKKATSLGVWFASPSLNRAGLTTLEQPNFSSQSIGAGYSTQK